jgi:hypothetical protein
VFWLVLASIATGYICWRGVVVVGNLRFGLGVGTSLLAWMMSKSLIEKV